VDDRVKAELRTQLHRLLGARRFLVHDSHSDRLGVAFPETVVEVQRIAQLSRDAKVPLIPRGATTNPFAGLEPQDGLVVSFDRLAWIGAANARTRLVTVQPGVLWHTLIQHLAERSLMPRVYPSSAGFSTVGGFVAQGGVGVGSYEFGDVAGTVASARVVDANGELRRLKGSQVGLVAGAQGRTGLLVDVLLRVQAETPMAPAILLFNGFDRAENAIADISRRGLPIWSIHLLDPAGGALASRNWPDLPVPPGQHAVLVAFRAADAGDAAAGLRSAARTAGGDIVEVAANTVDWIMQFASLQALATTPLPMQFHLPLGEASAMVRSIPDKLRKELAFEAVVTDRGAGIILRLFFVERQSSVDEAGRVARQLLGLAKRVGGGAYTTGALYLDEAEAVFGAERLRQLAEFRQLVDPDDRLNPGRAFRS